MQKEEVISGKFLVIPLLLLFSIILFSNPVNSAFACGSSWFLNGTVYNVLNGDTINGTNYFNASWSGTNGNVTNISVFYRVGTNTRVLISRNVTMTNNTAMIPFTWDTTGIADSSTVYINITIFNGSGGTTENTHLQCQYSVFLVDNTPPIAILSLTGKNPMHIDEFQEADGSQSTDTVDTQLSYNFTVTDSTGTSVNSVYLTNQAPQDGKRSYDMGTTFLSLGTYTVNMTVYDNLGKSNTTTISLDVHSREDGAVKKEAETKAEKSNLPLIGGSILALLAVIIIIVILLNKKD